MYFVAGMADIKVNDIVELLLGVDVVGRGMVMHVDPTVTLHGSPLPRGHIGISVTHVYDPKMWKYHTRLHMNQM